MWRSIFQFAHRSAKEDAEDKIERITKDKPELSKELGKADKNHDGEDVG